MSLDELDEIKVLSASELMEMGTLGEAAFVRMWVRNEDYRHRAQDLYYGKDPQKDGTGFEQPPSSTYPYYETD